MLQTLRNESSWNVISTTYHWRPTNLVGNNFNILLWTNHPCTLRMKAKSVRVFITTCQITRYYLPKPIILNTNTDNLQTSEVINATGVLNLREITQFQIHKKQRQGQSPLLGLQVIYGWSGKYTAQMCRNSVRLAVKVGNNVEKRVRISLTNQTKRRKNEYISMGYLSEEVQK